MAEEVLRSFKKELHVLRTEAHSLQILAQLLGCRSEKEGLIVPSFKTFLHIQFAMEKV